MRGVSRHGYLSFGYIFIVVFTVRATWISRDLDSIAWEACANRAKPCELGPLRSRAWTRIDKKVTLIQWLFVTPLQPCRDSSRWKVFFAPITAFIVYKLCNMAAQLKVSSQVQGVGGGVEWIDERRLHHSFFSYCKRQKNLIWCFNSSACTSNEFF